MPRRSVRERLLDAADAVLFIDGAIGTPVDRILKEAGASPASLYTQFGSKDGLIAAALERRLEVWTEVWGRCLDEADSPTDRLLSVFTALRVYHDERLAERWCAFSGTAAAIRAPSPRVAAALAAETELLTTRLHELSVELLAESGNADARADAEALAEQLVVTYCGMLALMLRRDAHDAMDAGERTARVLVAAALSPHRRT